MLPKKDQHTRSTDPPGRRQASRRFRPRRDYERARHFSEFFIGEFGCIGFEMAAHDNITRPAVQSQEGVAVLIQRPMVRERDSGGNQCARDNDGNRVHGITPSISATPTIPRARALARADR